MRGAPFPTYREKSEARESPFAVRDNPGDWTPNCCDRHKRGRISRKAIEDCQFRERTPGSRLRRPCGEPQGVGHLCPRGSSNVEGRKPWAMASDVLPGDDRPSIQLSSEGIRGSAQGTGKGENGRHWGCYAEAPAYLLRGVKIRSSLRRFTPSVGLIPLW